MTRSQNDKLDAIRHVVHDYANLVSGGELTQTDLPNRINHHVEESFLINSRALAYFFKNEGRADDIKSEDFLTSQIVFDLPTWDLWQRHMDKHLAHLTYTRVDNKTPWVGGPVNKQILQEMQAAWRLFLSQLNDPFKTRYEQEIQAKERSEYRVCNLR